MSLHKKTLGAFSVLVLILLFASTGSSSAVSLTVPDPQTLWNGDCDSGFWNPQAVARGWTGGGAHSLGAVYMGVPVCGPSPAQGAPDGIDEYFNNRSPVAFVEWDCTDLAFRFAAKVYGVIPTGATGQQYVRSYNPSVDGGGLVTVKNGTPNQPPLPGDIVSFDGSNNGHVAVVVTSNVDSSGNGSVAMMSQNDTADGWRVLAVKNWTLQGFGDRVPYAWLHDPAGRGGSGQPDPGSTAPPTAGNPTSDAPVRLGKIFKVAVVIKPKAGGTVNGNRCLEGCVFKQKIVLKPVPKSGFVFKKWTGPCNVWKQTCTLRASVPLKTVTAVFAEKKIAL